MVKQRTPNSQDERSSRSAYDIISSVSSAGRTARLGREGQVFKSPTGELSTGSVKVAHLIEDQRVEVQFLAGGLLWVYRITVSTSGPYPLNRGSTPCIPI